MGRFTWVFLCAFSVLLVGVTHTRAEAVATCESVCGSRDGYFGNSIERQWDQLFTGKRVCRIEAPVSSREIRPDLSAGARMVAAILTGGCRMNRPVRMEFRDAMESEGSQGFVRRSFEMVGLQNKPGCVQEVPAGTSLRAGDVLRLGHQAMIVSSVGEDPFGIEARLAADSVALSYTGKSSSSDARQLCREWLMDSTKFQISVVFLSRESRHGMRVRQGTFGSLISEDHPGSIWDQTLQEWALSGCVQKVSEKGHRTAGVPPSRLKVERPIANGPGCRVPVSGEFSAQERECALCCAAGGKSP